MDVGVGYRLPCRVSAVHADVESLRFELLLEKVLDLPDESKGISVFFDRHVPERCDVTLWNNQSVAFRHWVLV